MPSCSSCADAARRRTPSTPTTSASATTATAPAPPRHAKPKPTPSHHAKPAPHAPLAGGDQTVETVTGDGNVLLLDDGDVYSTDEDASDWENENVSVSEDESKITKTDDGEQLEVSKIGESFNGEPYSGAGEEHNQDTNSSDGAIIVLEDGSVWVVADGDRSTASRWTDSTSITVSEAEGSEPGSYTLDDTEDHESVTATHIGGK